MAQVNMPKSSIGQQPVAEPQKKFQKVVKGYGQLPRFWGVDRGFGSFCKGSWD